MKVAIVGGGTSGLYLAWKLSQKGEGVVVFEKKKKIGKEVCSGLFSERILEFIPESRGLVENQIRFCKIHFPKRTIFLQFSKRFLVMNHLKLDETLFHLAKKEGAKILLGSQIKKEDFGELEKKFDRILGADGPFSVTRKYLKLKNPSLRLAFQGFIGFSNDLEGLIDKETVETWPTRNGFIWKIPRKEKIEYGIIERIGESKKIFEEFLKKRGLKLKNIRSAFVPQGMVFLKNPKITLCGDALGLTKPWSGGGVVWQIMANNLCLKNFPDFLKYQKGLKRFFLKKIIFSKVITRLVYFFGFYFPWIFPKKIKVESDFLL